MTEDTATEPTVEDVVGGEAFSLFPTLDLIADQFVTDEGIDFEGLTTEQLLRAVREAFLMHHQALQEIGASIQTLGMFMGSLDDRIEQMTAEAAPAASSIILLSLQKQD